MSLSSLRVDELNSSSGLPHTERRKQSHSLPALPHQAWKGKERKEGKKLAKECKT